MSKHQESYQGWTNYITWSIALTIDNEYQVFEKVGAFMRSVNGKIDGDIFREFCSSKLRIVSHVANWDELSDHYILKWKEGCWNDK